MTSTRKQARLAGFLYLLACVTAPFALIYVPSILIVPGNASATADHVRASGALLRLAIASELIGPIFLIFAVLAFYRLLRGVSETHALAMAALILISIPISFLNVLTELAALILAGNAGFLSAFERGERDALVTLFLRVHGQGVSLAAIFWGLWLFPFGILIMRSGFIPRILGVLLIVAGSGYLLGSFTSLLLPQAAGVASRVATVLEIGEVPLLVWLLVWGARTEPAETA